MTVTQRSKTGQLRTAAKNRGGKAQKLLLYQWNLSILETNIIQNPPHNPETVGSSPTAATINRWNQPIPAVFSYSRYRITEKVKDYE